MNRNKTPLKGQEGKKEKETGKEKSDKLEEKKTICREKVG
jgi:hypothetical protein